MKDYIKIKPDFTLDKDVDNSSPTMKENVFTNLTNYIPEQGAVGTRKGISSYSFTDNDATYVPADDPDCLMHLKFEGANWKDCEIQGANYMVTTAGSSSHIYADSGIKKVGTSSLNHDTSGMPGLGLALMYHKVNADLPALFPGEGADDIIMSFWYYGVYHADWSFEIVKHDSQSQAGGFSFGFDGSNRFRWYVTSEAGANRSCTTDVSFAYDVWWHIGCWSSKVVGNSGFMCYHEPSGNEYEKKMTVPGTLGGADRRDANFWVGLGNREVENIYMDDFILCNVVPSTEAAILAKIRLMRARGL